MVWNTESTLLLILHISEHIRMGLEEDFAAAAEDIGNNVNKTLTDDELKEVYALYKQGTIGDINTSRLGNVVIFILSFIFYIIKFICYILHFDIFP